MDGPFITSTIRELGVAGVLVLGLLALATGKLKSKPHHDEVVGMLKEHAAGLTKQLDDAIAQRDAALSDRDAWRAVALRSTVTAETAVAAPLTTEQGVSRDR